MGKTIDIGGRLHSTEQGNVVAGANEIYDDTKGKKQNVINDEVDAALESLDESKQDNLSFDQTPTEDSENPVTSGGVYAADAALQQAIEAILTLIPSAASALNQLADKQFVNSSIATSTATFRGTYNLVSDLHLSVSASHEQIATALASVVSTADNQDYAFVQVPTSDTSSDIRVTERYKFNGEVWMYEYDLNNSGFTAAQWEAINSTITLALVQKLGALPTAAELATLLLDKQNVLTFDNVPTSGSDNPVKSGGLYEKFTAIDAKIPSDADANNKLVAENRLAAYVGTIIEALDASFNLTSADGHITFRLTQADGLITSVQIATDDIASAAALTALGGRVSTNERDIDALQDAYAALTQSDIVVVNGALPSSGQQQNIIYRQPDPDHNPPQFYSDYMWNGTTWVLMATYNNAIDPRPKKASQNLVTSGGVFDNMGALDVSELNATENPHALATYADLSAALAAIPSDYQKGGMSIKFVQSSDNKYVQFRLMSQTFSTTEADWQSMNAKDKPVENSNDIVISDGIFRYSNDIRAELLKLTDEYYLIVDNKIDYANPGHDWQWRGTCVSCSEGDVFFVKAKTIGYEILPYAFINSSGDVLLTTPGNNDLSDSYHRIIAPANTAYVCFNSHINSGYSDPSFHRLGNVLSFVVNKVYDNTDRINDLTEFASYKKQYCYIDNGVFVESVNDLNHRYYKIPCNDGDYISVKYLYIQWATANVTCAFIDSNNNVIWQPFKGDCAENKILKAPQNNSYFVLVFSTAPFTENNAEIPYEVYKIQPNRINEQRAMVGELIKFQSGYVRPSDPFNPGSDLSWVYSMVKCSGNEKFVLNLRTAAADIPIGIVCDLYGNVIDTVTVLDSYESGLEYTTPLNAEFIIFNHANYSDAYPYYRVVRYGNGASSYNQSVKELSNEIENLKIKVIGVDVKKDGSGNFTTIQDAINSITDASPSKRYEVRIYDDFDFEDADMFDFHSGPCAILSKDYVDLVGMNGIRTLSYLPSTDKTTSQILWWIGNVNLKNLHFKITRGRYAVHGTYAGYAATELERMAENCIFEYVYVPSVWYEQIAFAEDVLTNQKEKFVRCKFIGTTGGAAGHTMDVEYKQFKTEIVFDTCEFIVPKNVNAIGYGSLGTHGDYQVVLKDCITSGILNNYMSEGWPSNHSELLNNPHYNVFNCGDNPFMSALLRQLSIISATKTIKAVSGTAKSDIFGNVIMQKEKIHGLDSYIVGSYDLTYFANGDFSTGYKHSLAYRLGDCSQNNKTLVITYSDDSIETITFDKNYKGSSDGSTEPAYTNEQVIAEINTQLSNSEAYYQIPASIYDYYMDSDLKVLKVNKTTSAIQQGKFVTESLGGGIELADYTNYIGFALIDVPDKNEFLPSPICISKKIMLGQSYSPSVSNTTNGTTYTIQNGALVESSSNVVGIVYDNILYLK